MNNFLFLFIPGQTIVNQNDIETPLKFGNENPSYLLTSFTNAPTYLSCHVLVKEQKKIFDDIEEPFYYPGEEDALHNEANIMQLYQQQFENHKNKSKFGELDTPKFQGIGTRLKRARLNGSDEDEEVPYGEQRSELIKHMYQNQLQVQADKSSIFTGLVSTKSRNDRRTKRDKNHDKHKATSDEEKSAESEERDMKMSAEEIRKMYQKQLHSHFIKSNSTTRIRRSTNEVDQSLMRYTWFRDDEEITITTENDTDKRYELLPNGTLKFFPNNETAGNYYCKAKYEVNAERNIFIGPIISRTTRVEFAGELSKILSSQMKYIISLEITNEQ